VLRVRKIFVPFKQNLDPMPRHVHNEADGVTEGNLLLSNAAPGPNMVLVSKDDGTVEWKSPA